MIRPLPTKSKGCTDRAALEKYFSKKLLAFYLPKDVPVLLWSQKQTLPLHDASPR